MLLVEEMSDPDGSTLFRLCTGSSAPGHAERKHRGLRAQSPPLDLATQTSSVRHRRRRSAYAAVSMDVHRYADEQWPAVDALEEEHMRRAHPKWIAASYARAVAERATAPAVASRPER